MDKFREKIIFEELKENVELKVKTLSPTKWILFDSETGQIYKGNNMGYWDRLDPVIKEENE